MHCPSSHNWLFAPCSSSPHQLHLPNCNKKEENGKGELCSYNSNSRVAQAGWLSPGESRWDYIPDDAKVFCWSLLDITYCLGVWLRDKNSSHYTPPNHGGTRAVTFVHHFSEWLIPGNLCGVGPERSLRWEWNIWLVWAQISHFFIRLYKRKCSTGI